MFLSLFPFGILGQVWYLIVSISDLCHLTYFVSFKWHFAGGPMVSHFYICSLGDMPIPYCLPFAAIAYYKCIVSECALFSLQYTRP